MVLPVAPAKPWAKVPPLITVADDVNAAAVSAAADACAGFSARELAKLALAWRAAAFASEDVTLTKARFDETLDIMLKQTVLKRRWHARALEKARERAEMEAANPPPQIVRQPFEIGD